jgi:hypothetical protein
MRKRIVLQRGIYHRRLPHQFGRAGKGRADGVSVERNTCGITLSKTAVGGVAGLFHFHSQCTIRVGNVGATVLKSTALVKTHGDAYALCSPN